MTWTVRLIEFARLFYGIRDNRLTWFDLRKFEMYIDFREKKIFVHFHSSKYHVYQRFVFTITSNDSTTISPIEWKTGWSSEISAFSVYEPRRVRVSRWRYGLRERLHVVWVRTDKGDARSAGTLIKCKNVIILLWSQLSKTAVPITNLIRSYSNARSWTLVEFVNIKVRTVHT